MTKFYLIKNKDSFGFLVFLSFCLFAVSCRMPESSGFYSPITMSMKVPDGPPEFQAGWYAGCKSGNANQAFANSFVFQGKNGPDYGSGVYQHDPYFQIGWRTGFTACVTHIGSFMSEKYSGNAPMAR